MDWPPVSACLLSWKRPDNIRRIVTALRDLPFIDEILVWNNDPAAAFSLGDKVRVLRSGENLCCYGRYRCAAEARNPIVYFQDDDALQPKLADLYCHFLSDPTRLTHALSKWHYDKRNRYVYGECQSALVGWGAFAGREWSSLLDRVTAPIRESWLFRREADKFFSILLERRHRPVLAPAIELPGHSVPGTALWKDREHRRFGALAIREALRLVRLRMPEGMPPAWNVAIPCYNYGHYLRDAVESVLQNDTDYEITVVDDGSSDSTPAVAEQLREEYPWICYLRSPQNRGAGWARNRGIAAVDSLFSLVLDADDRIGPDYLHAAEQVLRQGADVANPDAILFGDQRGRWPVPDHVTLPMMLQRNRVHCCAGFRRGYWAQVGGFDERMPRWEDYEFWLRVSASQARIRAVRGDHFYYRRHAGSRSSKPIAGQMRAYIEAKHRHLFETGRPSPALAAR